MLPPRKPSQVKTGLWGKTDSNKGNELTVHYKSEEMSWTKSEGRPLL